MEKEVKKNNSKVKNEKINKNVVIDSEDVIILKNEERKIIKFVALVTTFFTSALAIMMFVFGVVATISIATLSHDELVNNNIVVTLLSKMNGYSIMEAKDLIMNMSSRVTIIVFEVVIPIIAFIGAMMLLVILSKRIMDFILDVKFEKDLFKKRKIYDLQDIVSIISIVLLAFLVLFNEPSIIFYLLIELLLFMVYGLFKKCVKDEKK